MERDKSDNAFRIYRAVYLVGSVISIGSYIWLGVLWPHNSNSLDPEKAKLAAEMITASWSCLLFGLIGITMILASSQWRRQKLVCVATCLSFVFSIFIFAKAYQ